MKEKLGILSVVIPYLAWFHSGILSVSADGLLVACPIAIVGAAIAAVGVAKSVSSANKAQDQQAAFLDDLIKKIRKSLSGSALTDKAGAILPKFRELESLGAIPAFQSAAATQLSRLGLDDTGLGAALGAAAGGAGELAALTSALQTAKDLNIAQGNAIASIVGGAGVSGGASGSVTGSLLSTFGQGLATSGLGAGKPIPAGKPTP